MEESRSSPAPNHNRPRSRVHREAVEISSGSRRPIDLSWTGSQTTEAQTDFNDRGNSTIEPRPHQSSGRINTAAMRDIDTGESTVYAHDNHYADAYHTYSALGHATSRSIPHLHSRSSQRTITTMPSSNWGYQSGAVVDDNDHTYGLPPSTSVTYHAMSRHVPNLHDHIELEETETSVALADHYHSSAVASTYSASMSYMSASVPLARFLDEEDGYMDQPWTPAISHAHPINSGQDLYTTQRIQLAIQESKICKIRGFLSEVDGVLGEEFGRRPTQGAQSSSRQRDYRDAADDHRAE